MIEETTYCKLGLCFHEAFLQEAAIDQLTPKQTIEYSYLKFGLGIFCALGGDQLSL